MDSTSTVEEFSNILDILELLIEINEDPCCSNLLLKWRKNIRGEFCLFNEKLHAEERNWETIGFLSLMYRRTIKFFLFFKSILDISLATNSRLIYFIKIKI